MGATMFSRIVSVLFIPFIAIVPASRAVDADDAPVRLDPVERWTSFFADREVELSFTVKPTVAFKGRAAWSVSIDEATLVRRTADISASPQRPGKLVVRFAAPPVREGVVLRATLALRVLGADGKAQGGIERVLWIFPETPFAGRSKWLKELEITLFDPAHTTAEVLTKAGVPFEEQNNLGSLAELRKGMLVIGEGASFKEEPGLAPILIKLAARGLPVLCLAPLEGTLTLPSGAADKERPEGLTLRRRSVITRLDKRLDAVAWPDDGKVVSTSLTLGMEDGALTGEVMAGEGGWPWLEVEHEGKGRLIVCGFGIIKHWAKSPTPRFLFAALLTRLAGEDPAATAEKRH
jgi:hypothetical protein